MFLLLSKNLTIFTFTFVLKCFVQAQNAENFLVESYEWCKNVTDPLIKMYITFKDFTPGHQTVDANLSTPIVMGENALLTASLDMETKLKPGLWIHLFTVEDDFCRVIQMYIGEFWYEVERAAALPPKTCPIPKGNYHILNYKLNFAKLKLQTFPFGRLRVMMQMQDKRTKEVFCCSIGMIRNYIS